MRIVHISDLHLRHHLPGSSENPARLSRAAPALFSNAVKRIHALDPDLFVLSGDLLDYPLDRMEDSHYRRLGIMDLGIVEWLLEDITCPRVLVYGNHDHPVLFREVFDPVMVDGDEAGLRALAFLDEEGPGNVPVRTANEWRRFEAALSIADSPWQLHVQHYVVWPPRNENYPHTYGTGETMRNAIVSSGNVRLVLSGHYHPGVEPMQSDEVWFATAPAFCEYPHPFWVYDVDEAGFRWQQHEVSA